MRRFTTHVYLTPLELGRGEATSHGDTRGEGEGCHLQVGIVPYSMCGAEVDKLFGLCVLGDVLQYTRHRRQLNFEDAKVEWLGGQHRDEAQ